MNKKLIFGASIIIIGKALLSPQISFADISDLTNNNLNKLSTKNNYTNNVNTINTIPLTNNNTSFVDNTSTPPPTFYFEDQGSTALQTMPQTIPQPQTILQVISQDMPTINPINNTDTGINNVNNPTAQTIPQNMPAPIQNDTNNNMPQDTPLISPIGNNADTSINKTSNPTVQTMPQNVQSTNINPNYLNSQPEPAEINADSETKPPPIPSDIKKNLRILKNNYYLVKPLTAKSLSYTQENRQKINAAPETITPTVIDDTPRVMIYQPPANNTTESSYPIQPNTQQNMPETALSQPGQNNTIPENKGLYTNIPAKDMPGENTPYENSELNNPESRHNKQVKKAGNQTNTPHTKTKHAANNTALNILKTVMGMLIKFVLILVALAIMGLLLHAFRSSFNGNIS